MDNCQPLPRFTIAAPQLFDGTSLRGASLVTVSGGLIDSVSYGQAPSPATVSLPADAILAPGFIDIQVNGGCVYRKLKHGRSGDEVRPGRRVN